MSEFVEQQKKYLDQVKKIYDEWSGTIVPNDRLQFIEYIRRFGWSISILGTSWNTWAVNQTLASPDIKHLESVFKTLRETLLSLLKFTLESMEQEFVEFEEIVTTQKLQGETKTDHPVIV